MFRFSSVRQYFLFSQIGGKFGFLTYHMYTPRILLVLWLGFFSLTLKSQSGSELFYRMYTDYGLPSDKTTVSLQDHLGFMWFGTEDGLSRMSGYTDFEVFSNSRTDSSTLSHNYVSALFEDSKGRLWVGTKDGLNLYNRASRTFTHFPLQHGMSDLGRSTIVDIQEDKSGDLWILCDKHVIQLDRNTLKEKLLVEAVGVAGRKEDRLTRLTIFQSEVWVASSGGLLKLQGEKLVDSGLIGAEYVTSLLSADSTLWFGTKGRGLFRWDASKDKVKEYSIDIDAYSLTSNLINDIHYVAGEELWIATDDGINVLNLKTGSFKSHKYDFNNAFSISDKALRRVYEDRDGAVWITTPNSGISYYHRADNLFKYFGQSNENGTSKDLMDYSVSSTFSARDGSTWLGSRKGISRFETKTNDFEHYPFLGPLSKEISSVLSIAQCSANYLWLGTDNGLVKWTGNEKDFQYVMPSKLKGLNIKTVMADEADNLWLGTDTKGVQLYASASKILREVVFEVEGSPLEYSPSVNIIKKLGTKIFVGTEKGLFLRKDLTLTKVSFNGFKDLSDEISINDIFQDTNGRIWLGTEQDGIILLSPDLKTLARYTTESHAIANNDIKSIVEDKDGMIWLSTNSGLSKLVLKSETIDNPNVSNYDITDGLQGDQFAARAGTIVDDGRVMFGGLNGLTVFNPDNLETFKIQQHPTFVGLEVKGEVMEVGAENSPLIKDITELDEIRLNPTQNDFVIKFEALDFIRPDDVVYRYKMSGYDDDWIIKEGFGEAAYQNISAGKTFDFVFQSKGRLSPDWSEERHLRVYVVPYYYQTTWFKIMVVVLIIGAIIFFIWARDMRAKLKRIELESLVEERSSSLREEILQRKETEVKLTTALEDAKGANEIKDKFLANMSHEIRTPLNGIMGLTQLSLESDLDEEQEDMLKTISSSADSLQAIVNDLLDIAKIESGSLKLVTEPFSVKDMLKEVISSFMPTAMAKDLKLEHWILTDVPAYVSGDLKLIRQVLTNLISNAIKFTDIGGVTVFVESLRSEEDDDLELWFTVTDTGIGIAKEDQERIFESFNQVDSGNTRKYQGTGLGLSISKEFVKKMGGELWVESEEGKGSIFKFHVKIKTFDLISLEKKSRKRTKKQEEQLTGNVLLAEDNLINQKVAVKMLEKRGLNVICAEDGQTALDLLESANFDVIVMDLMMPILDGYETTDRIRNSTSPKSNIPIIALTAAAMEGEREKCLAAGMNDYITKPVSYKTLIESIVPFLGSNKKLELS